MILFFFVYGLFEGIESRFYEWWIKRFVDYYYSYFYGFEYMKIIVRYGFLVELYFNEFFLGGEVFLDYEFYYNIFDDDEIEDYVNFWVYVILLNIEKMY